MAPGDAVSVDFGVRLDGWCGDAAETFLVGEALRPSAPALGEASAWWAPALGPGHAGVSVGGRF